MKLVRLAFYRRRIDGIGEVMCKAPFNFVSYDLKGDYAIEPANMSDILDPDDNELHLRPHIDEVYITGIEMVENTGDFSYGKAVDV